MEAEQWAPASPIQKPAQKELIMERVGGASYQGPLRASDTGFFFDILLVGGGLGKLEIIVGESWILRLCNRMHKIHPGPVVPVALVAGNNFFRSSQ